MVAAATLLLGGLLLRSPALKPVRVSCASEAVEDDDALIGSQTIVRSADHDDQLIGESIPANALPPRVSDIHLAERRMREWDGRQGVPYASPPPLPPLEPKEGLSITETREALLGAASALAAENRASLLGAGVGSRKADALLRKYPELKTIPSDVLAHRVTLLRELLGSRDAAVAVISNAPYLLSQSDLSRTLPVRLSTLYKLTGLSTIQLTRAAPGLLYLDAQDMPERYQRLRSALPESFELQEALRRAPLLLTRRPETVASRLAAVESALAPNGKCAARLVQLQPTLHANSAKGTLEPKLRRLRDLCSDAEWQLLTTSKLAALARALTCSAGVIERLAEVPPYDSGRPRPFFRIIQASKTAWPEIRDGLRYRL